LAKAKQQLPQARFESSAEFSQYRTLVRAVTNETRKRDTQTRVHFNEQQTVIFDADDVGNRKSIPLEDIEASTALPCAASRDATCIRKNDMPPAARQIIS
jgi:hypothetical protein